MDTQPSLEPPSPPLTLAGLPSRYVVSKRLAGGGQGEVYRALDTRLDREVALKVLFNAGRSNDLVKVQREVRLMVRLQHHGVVAVHDVGHLDDGRVWFAMREVLGEGLDIWLLKLRRETSRFPFDNLRPLVEVVEAICRTVAYAHQEGVIHCDLKPANLMVEGQGEVQVLDWGAARTVGEPAELVQAASVHIEAGRAVTLTDKILGTPHYMAPEWVLTGRIGPPADVYAMGVILYESLVGRLPYQCPVEDVLRQLRFQPPPSIFQVLDSVDRDVRDLQLIIERAMARSVEERYAHCGVLAGVLADWQRTFDERAAADRLVKRADEIRMAVAGLRNDRARVLDRVAAAWNSVQPYDSIEKKRTCWGLEDEARAVSHLIQQRSLDMEQELYAALSRDRHNSRVNQALATLYRQLAEDAEATRQDDVAEAFVRRVQRHDQGEHQSWAEGLGQLSISTEPPGARVVLHRLVERDRQMRREPTGIELGTTPLHETTLRRGHYLARLLGPNGECTHYPVTIRRGAHWDGVPPDEPFRRPITLCRPNDEHCYVPAGWFQSGGDPLAPDAVDPTLRWADGFLIEKFPVTNARYLEFLNHLVKVGDMDSARRFCPRVGRGVAGGEDGPSLFVEVDGRLELPDHPHWQPELPVTLVNWYGANAFAAWQAERSGRPWRLPHSLEWEKAARGVNGSQFPWGDHAEPTYANMLRAHAGVPARTPVDSFPEDESVYGVRGLAGNVRDWCMNMYRRAEPERRVVVHPGDGEWCNVRGGAFSCEAHHCRGAARFVNRKDERLGSLGFRLACSTDRTP